MVNENKITTGNIFINLTKFTIPILFSLILQALYGAVDLYMVGQFGINADVSAVSIGSQTMMIVTGIITGLAVGITVLLGNAIGRKDDNYAANIIGTSTWIFLIISLIIAIILSGGSNIIAKLLNTPDTALTRTSNYILICGIGTIFIIGFNVFNGIFCGIGDSKTPLLFVGIASIINVILDYILVKIFSLGSVGAAIATIVSQFSSCIFCLAIFKKKVPFKVNKNNFKFDKNLAFKIIRIGLPVALLRMCTEISYLVILEIVNIHGDIVSSGVGIAEKLVMFILLIPTAYMSSISTFVAQNKGVGNNIRVKKTLLIGILSSLSFGAIMSSLSFFYGDYLSMIFISDPNVINASKEFLKATSIECLFLSVSYCFDGYFNGIGKPTIVMIRGIIAAICVRIPLAYLFSISTNPSLFKIGLSTAFAAIFMLIFCIIEYIVRSIKERKETVSNSFL